MLSQLEMAVSGEGLLHEEFEEAEEEFMNDSRVEREFESDEDGQKFDTFAVQTRSSLPVDDDVSEYLARGCGCQKYEGRPYSAAFSCEEVTAYRFELERGELDMAMLAQLHAGMNAEQLLTNTRGSTRPESRQRVTFT